MACCSCAVVAWQCQAASNCHMFPEQAAAVDTRHSELGIPGGLRIGAVKCANPSTWARSRLRLSSHRRLETGVSERAWAGDRLCLPCGSSGCSRPGSYPVLLLTDRRRVTLYVRHSHGAPALSIACCSSEPRHRRSPPRATCLLQPPNLLLQLLGIPGLASSAGFLMTTKTASVRCASGRADLSMKRRRTLRMPEPHPELQPESPPSLCVVVLFHEASLEPD